MRLASCFLFLSLLWGCRSGLDIHRPSLGHSTPLPPLPQSIVSVPVNVNLASLAKELEAVVPKEQHASADWMVVAKNPVGDMGVKYEAWREPLTMKMRGSALITEAHLFYWLEAGQRVPKPIIGGSFWQTLASCGRSEPPREAILGMQTSIALTPEWQMRPTSTPEPAVYPNKCKITFLNIDVTDRVDDAFTKGLQQGAGLADARLRSQGNLRPMAEQAWRRLQEPIRIDSTIWLVVNPESASASPPGGDGTTARITASITAHPTVLFGPRPASGTRPLPSLQIRQPGDGFHVAIEGEISFEDATTQLARIFRGTKQNLDGREITITDVKVFGSGDMAVLQVALTGDLDGTVYLAGRPVYDDRSGLLTIADLDYSVETKATLVKIADWLYHGSFRETIAQQAKLGLASGIGEARRELQRGLNRQLAPNIALVGTVSAIRPVGVFVTASGFRARIMVDGALRVEVN